MIPVCNSNVIKMLFFTWLIKALQLWKTPFIYDADVCIYKEKRCNVIKINVIFVGDCNHCYLHSLDGSGCQNLRLPCPVMGKHASNWRRDVITLTFDLWRRARRWCGSSYSVRASSLKSAGMGQTNWRTNRWTDNSHHCIMPITCGGGGIIRTHTHASTCIRVD